MRDAASAVRRLADHLRNGAPLPAPDRELLATGLERWLAVRGEIQLDKALGLRTWGGVSVSRALVLAERDKLLRGLWRSQTEWRDLPAFAAARLMVISADRYERGRWPRERSRPDAPAGEPAATWWRCLSLGAGIPDAKRMGQVLSGD